MSIRHFIHTVLSIAVIAMTALLLPSCAEERFAVPDYTISGEEVTLSVPLLIPQMPESTRGDLSPNQLNKVGSLWIRTYNAETKEATCDWLKLTPNTADVNNMREVTLTTKSGFSYIVAVANVEHMGISGNLPAEGGLPQLKPLSELLEAADTWDKFLQIAVAAPSDEDDVNAPQSNTLPMAGCYSDAIATGNNVEPVSLDTWQTADFQPYFIPASKDNITFTGGIHLRRLVSHIRFNFFAGDDIDLTVNSYQVMNAPKYTWLYERNEEMTNVPNYGDQATTAAEAKRYYADVPQYGSQFIKDGEAVDGKTPQTFDFWLSENKHTGNCSTYADRGLKKKDDSDLMLFTSLTGETWTATNEASYVVVDCDIKYKHSIKVDEDGALDSTNGTPVDRSGHATYFIHLGYILGNDEAAKAKDFNCFRNVNYTYNVTVNGLDDIRVDATADIEKYHGEEGLVVDLSANTYTLDGHYAVFNIELKPEELTENFGFIITTYDNGEQITINETNKRKIVNNSIVIYEDEAMTKPIDPKYYNWIELRATTDANTLAEYKPRYGTNVATERPTFLLTDLYTYKNGNGETVMNLPESYISTSGWYTVFVNEYTYEPMYTGSEGYADETTPVGQRPAWMNYVNQNPRRFYIKVSYRESPDGNSVYARSKYAVQQQSLMTYYSQQNLAPDRTAIGVERENETLGMNLRHVYVGGGSSYNGRWNTAQFLDNADKLVNILTINNASSDDRPSWHNYVYPTEALYVPEVTYMRLQGGPSIPGGTKSIPKVKKSPGDNTEAVFNDPQPDAEYNIEYMSACLARNRDNNGNGRIEPDELRWFVPAIENYIDISLGSNALPRPLMDYQTIHQLPRVVNKASFVFTDDLNTGTINNHFYSRYMFVASNTASSTSGEYNVLWGMEGSSLSAYKDLYNWSNKLIYPWQIRCIRNLGSDMRNVTNTHKVTTPFVIDRTSRTLSMNYFNLASIRTQLYFGNGKDNSNLMPVHTINSSYNSVYSAFEYANEDFEIPAGTMTEDDYWAHYFDNLVNYINSNPCANRFEGENWRVPNQIELTMMMNAGILSGGGTAWVSSTVNYFSNKTGEGSDRTNFKFFMGALQSRTIILDYDNYFKPWYPTKKIRCVRDIQP